MLNRRLMDHHHHHVGLAATHCRCSPPPQKSENVIATHDDRMICHFFLFFLRTEVPARTDYNCTKERPHHKHQLLHVHDNLDTVTLQVRLVMPARAQAKDTTTERLDTAKGTLLRQRPPGAASLPILSASSTI